MVARFKEVLLCPVCHMGKETGSNMMGKHYDMPGVITPCPGSGQQAVLPAENVICFILNVRYALIQMNDGVQSCWKWVCACGQHGAWKLTEQQADIGGDRHINGRKRS